MFAGSFRRTLSLLLLAMLALALTGCGSGEELVTVPITTSSDEARALYLKGLEYQENLRAIEAFEYFQQALELDPDFALAHLQMAGNLRASSERFEALANASARIEQVSAGEKLLIRSAEAAVDNDPVTQGELLSQLTEMFPLDKRTHLNLGTFYFGQQEFRKANSEFRKVNQLDDSFAPPYNMMGYCYRRLHDFKGAEKAFKIYIKLIPNDPNPYDSYAELLLEMGEFRESIDYYRQALAQDSNFFASRLGIASNYLHMGKHDRAREELAIMYRLAPSDQIRRAGLQAKSLTYIDEKDTDHAWEVMQESLAMAQSTGDSSWVAMDMRLIGFVQLEFGQYDQGEASFARAINASEASDSPEAAKEGGRRVDIFARSRLANYRGDYAQAKRLADEYRANVESMNNRFLMMASHLLYGQIAISEQRWDEAVQELTQTNRLNAYHTYQLALAYEGAGQFKEAKETARIVAELNSLMDINYVIVRTDAIKLYKSL